jgi:hypothetical protein
MLINFFPVLGVNLVMLLEVNATIYRQAFEEFLVQKAALLAGYSVISQSKNKGNLKNGQRSLIAVDAKCS